MSTDGRNPRPRWLVATLTVLDAISEWTGKTCAWLIIPLMGALVYEVFARYLFRAPTIWAYDVTFMLYAALFMLGTGYTLRYREHVRTDFIYNRLSVRAQGITDAVIYILLFLPAVVFFLFASWDAAYHSWHMGERSGSSIWRPPLAPFKTIVPVAMLLLLVQTVAEALRSLYAAVKGEAA
jgi:TRAP-type mannitol/chloroaromatic compound transport system permease small subunit